MGGRLLVLGLLLTGTMGCPETWGREGTIEQALHRDLVRSRLERSACTLSPEEWSKRCGVEAGNAPIRCPPGCPTAADYDQEEDL
jgi:hypothetical protein